MTKTEELLKLAEAAMPDWEGPINRNIQDLMDAANPAVIKQLVEGYRDAVDTLRRIAALIPNDDNQVTDTIAAFEKFERGES